jgi:hypothetical protein
MHGLVTRRKGTGKIYEYRRYVCNTERKDPGSCGNYSVGADKLVRALVRKLQAVYLAPERLEALQREILGQVESKRQRDPARAASLRKRLETLEADIRQGARNLVRATDNLDLIQEQLTELRGQKDRLQRELDSVEREQTVPVEQQAERVRQAIKRLETLRERLDQADPDRLKEVLRTLVCGVDLYFDTQVKPGPKGRKWYRFSKGIIRLRPILEFTGSAGNEVPPRGA